MLQKIKILMPGPLKFNFIKEGLEYYLKKINFFVPVEIIFLKVRTKVSEGSIRIKQEEKIFKNHISDKDYLIVLDEKGKIFKSKEIAERLEKLMVNQGYITFIIGGPEGVSENLKKIAKEIWSLSSLTFNHEIAILILAEVLYRSFCILKGIPYHRE